MSENLPTYSKLLVISDTGMYEQEGKVYAFGPVVKELDYFLTIFKDVTWIGFNRPDQIGNKSYNEVTNNNVKVLGLKNVGGTQLKSKLQVLFQYPKMFQEVLKEVKKHNYIHCRAPSQPAFLSMFLTFLFPKKQFWFKYAGSWVDKTSVSYNLQRKTLQILPSHVKTTINGHWEDQKATIITFENPCLTILDRELGAQIKKQKKLLKPSKYCFVGNLDSNKGVDILVETFKIYSNIEIDTLHIVGDGPLRNALESSLESVKFKVVFHGFLSRETLMEIYKVCHFIVLPSKSEGFPKVIAEAMNYGCVPVVTIVSCIEQYIKNETNGFLLEDVSHVSLQKALLKINDLKEDEYKTMIEYNYNLAKKFTYQYYINQIVKLIYVKN